MFWSTCVGYSSGRRRLNDEAAFLHGKRNARGITFERIIRRKLYPAVSVVSGKEASVKLFEMTQIAMYIRILLTKTNLQIHRYGRLYLEKRYKMKLN